MIPLVEDRNAVDTAMKAPSTSLTVTKVYSADESNMQIQPGCGVLGMYCTACSILFKLFSNLSHLTAQCINGLVPCEVALQGSQLGSSVSFVAGFNQAVKWLDQAVANACHGDVLHVVSSLSAGESSWTVVVLSVNPSTLNSVQDGHSRVEEHRLKGNKLLTDPKSKPKNWRDAIVEYNRALHWQNLSPDANQSIISLRLNIALGNLKLKNWERAATQCDAVLLHDPRNVKALYRRARASFERRLFQTAISDLRKAHKLAPTDRAVADLLDQAANKHYADLQKRRQEFAEVYAKLLQGPAFEKQEVV